MTVRPARTWTEDRVLRLLALDDDDASVGEMARAFGVSEKAVAKKLLKLGRPRRKGRPGEGGKTAGGHHPRDGRPKSNESAFRAAMLRHLLHKQAEQKRAQIQVVE